jgi:hypothetical protein
MSEAIPFEEPNRAPIEGRWDQMPPADQDMSRIEITPRIRVLDAGNRGWAVWDDDEEECPLFETKEQAIEEAQGRAKEKADILAADTDWEHMQSLNHGSGK